MHKGKWIKKMCEINVFDWLIVLIAMYEQSIYSVTISY